MRLSLYAFASITAVAATIAAAPSVRAQEAAPATPADPAMAQPGTMQPGMMGGSYTRSMMVSKNDATGANSIAAIAMSDPQFSTLVSLVKLAGLDNSLMYRGPLTVFAPTNEAFDKLPRATVKMLMMPENIKYLQAILMYHIVPGGYSAADVTALNGQTVATTSRTNPLTIGAGPSINYGGSGMMNSGMNSNTNMNAGGDMSSGMSMTGTARITRADIMASNGVIHVIDTVLLPPMDMMTQKSMMMGGKRMMDKDKTDKSLLKEAEAAQKSTPEQLKDKPLGGSPTETPKAEEPKTP